MEPKNFNRYLEMRLNIWALYHHYILIGEKGWPPVSVLAIMLETGTTNDSYFSSKPPTGIANELAEEMNAFINRMQHHRPQYADAIKAVYIEKRAGLHLIDLARKRKISVSTLKQRAQGAKDWLSGILEHETNDKKFTEPKKSA
jgi:hypothetical protein